jgi:hypothetical protein
MAFDKIHVEETAMVTAVNRSNDVNTSILDYEKQLTGIAEMVKEVWGGKAKAAFDVKHQEIVGYLGVNAADALGISEGTNMSLNTSLAADDDSAAVIAAINGQA